MNNRFRYGGLGVLIFLWVSLLLNSALTTTDAAHVPLKFRSGQKSSQQAVRGSAGIPALLQSAKTVPHESTFGTPKNIFVPLEDVIEMQKRERIRALQQELQARKMEAVRVDKIVKAQARQASTKPETTTVYSAIEQNSEAVNDRRVLSTQEIFGPPLPTQAERAAEQVRREQELAAERVRQQRELALQQARQLMEQYRFLGYLMRGGEQRAFIGKGRELYIVGMGEAVEGRLKIKAMTESSVKLLDSNTSLEATLQLSKDSGGRF
jgi:hypothetical protein